ncbi:LCP family protein [Streptomonospora sp. S1-112]|uniref:LCP family protein n=1 Tax=Streptomonospora mangrovi TaxID=2883123 RepID=A0A9X3SH04_9ACTN|nr:LCP family protein [Streptomonospora mangrovi]MDA0566550.1 LCP family protein [Streptomonospora mangrovi]
MPDDAAFDAAPDTPAPERPGAPTETGTDSGAPGVADTPAAPRRGRRRRALGWTAAAVAALLVVGTGTSYAYYRSLSGNMVRHDLDSALVEEERPEKIGDDLNILFIGSDGREGGNAAYGGRDFVGERSDALMLAHISPDGGVQVVNFPRDSLVQIPECAPYGETEGTESYYGMINAALFHGGPPCVVKTIETLTDVRIDHFAHLSFVGFRDMVEAIGGVEMCIPQPMRDVRAQLDLEAGRQRLDGEEALAFVRARYEIGDGGDIGRIDRQQMFLGALADEVTGSGVLTDPRRTTALLEAVTEHTGTDDDFDLPTMISIGSTLAGVELSDIAFYTVPWQQAPFDPNRVVWDPELSAKLFTAIRNDRPVDDRFLLTGEEAGDTGGGADHGDTAGAPAPPAPGAEPVAPSAADGVADNAADNAAATSGATASPAADRAGTADGAEATGPGRVQGRDATSNPCANGLGDGTEAELR